jgi:hypothetical protein
MCNGPRAATCWNSRSTCDSSADVRLQPVRRQAFVAQRLRCSLRFRFVATHDQHMGAGLRQAARHAQADAAIAARDQRHFSRQIEHVHSMTAEAAEHNPGHAPDRPRH